MDVRTPEVTRRELAKAERKRRIVEAAAALVREQGFEAVSMVQIAERAGVAPATLYNLFQTKGAIFGRIFDLDLEVYVRDVVEAPARHSVDRMFVAIDLAASRYRRDPDFYRAMARAGEFGGARLGMAINEPRVAFWQAQVASAVAERQLRHDADPDILGMTLVQIIRGAFVEWAGGLVTPERFAAEASYGVALALLAYASDEATPLLRRRIAELTAELAARPRKARPWTPSDG